jgi:RNA polymerase sigma factor (sigma-70 family)
MNLNTFKTQVLPVKDKLYRFALRLVADPEEAKDVVQEAMVRVWRHIEKLDGLDNVEAWCMRITRNVAIDKIKERSRRFTSSLYEVADVSDGGDKTPYSDVAWKDTYGKINRLIANLPEKQKAVIQLRDVEGYSYKEISDIMGIDMNQVKVNLFRARQTVKENLIMINAYGT